MTVMQIIGRRNFEDSRPCTKLLRLTVPAKGMFLCVIFTSFLQSDENTKSVCGLTWQDSANTKSLVKIFEKSLNKSKQIIGNASLSKRPKISCTVMWCISRTHSLITWTAYSWGCQLSLSNRRQCLVTGSFWIEYTFTHVRLVIARQPKKKPWTECTELAENQKSGAIMFPTFLRGLHSTCFCVYQNITFTTKSSEKLHRKLII